MNKNILRVSIAIAVAIFLVVISRIVFLSFSQSEKPQTSSQGTVSVASKESKVLKQAKELLTLGQRAEAIKQLEQIADSSKGQRDGYEAVLTLADIYSKDRNLLKAKALYYETINEYSQFCDYASVQKKIASVNTALLFSNILTPESELYIVVPGDSLAKIAGRYSTTVELIKRANNLKSDIIIPGMKLKVQNKPFSIIVDNKQCVLTVLLGDEVIKIYGVATGKNNSTPIGLFKVRDKLVDPVWYNKGLAVPAESPENVLGTRWMGLTTPEPGYGIHGTTEPDSIGYQSTEGCIRMRNKDVEELYSIIPLGISVTVID
ncbi:LysM peptidoglycan-binding domain-containing protein [bacterium]|nr:MAG: LysM peptidoglycan-binding domain-containing protein [bacterium]